MTRVIEFFRQLHDTIFRLVERLTDGWFFGLFARFVFAATLYVYFLNSAKTKVGEGILGFFQVSDGAYIQIAGKAFEAAGYDSSALPLSAHIMVIAGTYAEFILPLLVILGLFARIGAVGMIIFIFVQSYVDVTAHGVALGSLFSGQPGDIMAQRLLWIVPLVYIALRGAGKIALDFPLSRWWQRKMTGW